MCKVFDISKSGYYDWLQREPSVRWQENEYLLTRITKIFALSGQSYGSPRITKELNKEGIKISRTRVARIMKSAGLFARRRRKFVPTTDSKHDYPIAPNVLNRQFKADRENQVWVSDLTYVRTDAGWLYLTVIIDLYDRKVIGWSMSEGLSASETIVLAWIMAITNRPITRELIFHSDRGVQYACEEFTKLLDKQNGLVIRSMSRKGNCWDNSVAESFFKTIKVEKIYNCHYSNRQQARLSIFEWIETWYNRHRRHSALHYMTIEEFEINNCNFKSVA